MKGNTKSNSKQKVSAAAEALVDRLVDAGLPTETIESFRRVVVHTSYHGEDECKSEDDRSSAAEGQRSTKISNSPGRPKDDHDQQQVKGKGVKVVLRSKGRPLDEHVSFPLNLRPAPSPPLVVCLAHDQQENSDPSSSDDDDIFTLFAFTKHSIPCRLSRFNREGKKIIKKAVQKEKNEYKDGYGYGYGWKNNSKNSSSSIDWKERYRYGASSCDNADADGDSDGTEISILPYFQWDLHDANVLVSAVEQCNEKYGYFHSDKLHSDDNCDEETADANADAKAKADIEDHANSDDTNPMKIAECLHLTSWPSWQRSHILNTCTHIDTDDEGEEDTAWSIPARIQSDEKDEEFDKLVKTMGITITAAQFIKEEAIAIRTLLLTELLNADTNMDTDSNTVSFLHPDPKFLMPLSYAIAKELERWRIICRNMPPTVTWPDLPKYEEGEDTDIGNENDNDNDNGKGEGEMTEEDIIARPEDPYERNLFHTIMDKRKCQTDKSYNIVRKAIERIQSLLHLTLAGGSDSNTMTTTATTIERTADNQPHHVNVMKGTMELGRGRAATLLSLIGIHRDHWNNDMHGWDDCNEAFGDVCDNTRIFHEYEKYMQDMMDAEASISSSWYDYSTNLVEGEMNDEDEDEDSSSDVGRKKSVATNSDAHIDVGEKKENADFNGRVDMNINDDENSNANLNTVTADPKVKAGTINKAIPEECDDDIENIDNAIDAAHFIINAWKRDDAAILSLIRSAFEVAEKAIEFKQFGGNTDENVNEEDENTIINDIQTISKKLDVEVKIGHSKSVRNVARFVKLWYNGEASECDDEDQEDDWQTNGASPSWTEDQQEAYFSFGLGVCWVPPTTMIPTPQLPLFLLDRRGFSNYVHSLISNWSLGNNKDDEDSYPDSDLYFDQSDIFGRFWKSTITPHLNSALMLIRRVVLIDYGDFGDGDGDGGCEDHNGDFYNASLLLLTCCRILCRGKTAGELQGQFDDPDDSYQSKQVVLDQLKEEADKFDSCVVQIVLKYFETNSTSKESSQHGWAHWCYNVLKSGIVTFPNKTINVQWATKKTNWREDYMEPYCPWNAAHHGANIFVHHGWLHPNLRKALSNEAESEDIKHWMGRESPLVIKQRFLITKRDETKTNASIALAKMLQGDPDALHYLVSMKRTNDAIIQASLSDNEKGLKQLAYDLIDSDPRASFLCAQTHLLRLFEKDPVQRYNHHETLDLFVDLFLQKWISTFVDPSDKSVSSNTIHISDPAPTTMKYSPVPPLSRLSILALTRRFLCASGSISQMQEILEKLEVNILGLDISLILAIASIAVVCQTSNKNGFVEGMGYALGRAGLLFKTKDSTGHFSYSGLLSNLHYDSFDDLPTRDRLEQLSYAIVECSQYEGEILLIKGPCHDAYGRTDNFNFVTGLIASVYATVHSRSQNVALRILDIIKTNCNKGHIRNTRDEPLPFSCIVACFSGLAFPTGGGENWKQNCYNLQKQLLETALSLRVCAGHTPENMMKEQLWVALAYKEHVGAEQAGTLLAESVFYYRKSERTDDAQENRSTFDMLKLLTMVDTREGIYLNLLQNNVMSPFALSNSRTHLNTSERCQMCSAYIGRILSLSSMSGSPIHPSLLASFVRMYRTFNPSFGNIDSMDQVDEWLSQSTNTSLASCFSDKQALHHVCRILYFAETWSTPYFILVCGLSWLRAVLLSTQLPEFDQVNEHNISSNRKFKRFVRDRTTLFDHDDWILLSQPNARHHLDRKPIFTSLAIIKIVEGYALDIHQDSAFADISHETLLLCQILHFLIRPSVSTLKKINETKENRPFSNFELPSYLEPTNLIDFVLRSDWGMMKGNFVCVNMQKHHAHKRVLQFIPRLGLALEYGRLKEAFSFCIAKSKRGILWDILSESSTTDDRKEIRELLHGCLLTLRAIAVTPTSPEVKVPKEFLDIVTHIIFIMNWFQCCEKCSAEILEKSTKLIPRKQNIEALRSAASAWSVVLEGNNHLKTMADLIHCARMICCLERCLTAYESVLAQRKVCASCRIKEEDYDDTQNNEFRANAKPATVISDRELRLTQRIKRRREREFDIAADFNELQSFIAQVHLKGPNVWVNHVLSRLKPFIIEKRDRCVTKSRR